MKEKKMRQVASRHQGVRQFRFSAIITYGKNSFSGENSKKSHPKLLMSGRDGVSYSTSHAEMAALLAAQRALGDDFKGVAHKLKLYVLRLNRAGELALAKPCKSCQKMLDAAGIKKYNILYTTNSMTWERLESITNHEQ